MSKLLKIQKIACFIEIILFELSYDCLDFLQIHTQTCMISLHASLCSSRNFDQCDTLICMHPVWIGSHALHYSFLPWKLTLWFFFIFLGKFRFWGPWKDVIEENNKRAERLMMRPTLGGNSKVGGVAKVRPIWLQNFRNCLSNQRKDFLNSKFKFKI